MANTVGFPRNPESAADRRLAALIESGLLDSDPDEAFDRYTRLTRRMLQVPVSLVSLVTDTRQFFKSQQGLGGPAAERRETPLSHSFCQLVLAGDPLIVPDSRAHPTLKDNPSVEELDVIAYAGYPIRNSDDHVFGALCAIDSEPHDWTEAELLLLADLAEAVSSEVRLREQLLREQRREAHLELVVSRLEGVQERLTDQLRVQEETTAIVSHDLRTPLSALLLSVGLMEEAGEEARGIAADRMRRAIRDMDVLIADLLDVVRLNARGLRYRFGEVATAEVIERLEELHAEAAREAGITLRLEPGTQQLVADRRRVVQALSNLLGNALRAVGEGGTVLVTAAPSSEGRSVVFSVRDDGPGIAPDRLERLFMPFAQGDRPGGAGLGLAIARGIALGHGGTLVAESTPGEGATFRLMLPRTPPAKSGARASSSQSLSADLPR